MLDLLLLIIFGIGIVFFSTQNTVGVPITVFNTTLQSVPLYIVILGFMFFGIFFSWIINIINSIGVSMKMSGKNAAIKTSRHTIEDLRDENHRLELEIARLKGEESVDPVVVEHAHGETHRPSLFERWKHNLR